MPDRGFRSDEGLAFEGPVGTAEVTSRTRVGRVIEGALLRVAEQAGDLAEVQPRVRRGISPPGPAVPARSGHERGVCPSLGRRSSDTQLVDDYYGRRAGRPAPWPQDSCLGPHGLFRAAWM